MKKAQNTNLTSVPIFEKFMFLAFICALVPVFWIF
ncbi:MAG: hypothetical protein UY59_C0035G0005 [Candidatus Kaiserbacteria bacterium GW2011_GWA1_50_28]|uniref:Uncharacterized protein n=2 Tax=Candidatus Kaiseribacteriota TaxID=1752734 RepID=A0A0G1WC84_9BACT|nr:MAG: hypothetical protein UY57_C0039G0005 [Candidatus Kaiserbacteria bacterium GW2011_GWB1_50_17]KKW17555.1 MAG: hypothetical protein UY59_C0035G0005 [Candidatus Kaiserbacteria bacterium GW2011_GWA1_50_28]